MHISIPPRNSREPLPRLVDELIQIGGSLSQIVGHMAMSEASGRSASGAPPVGAVLTGLLEDVLAPLSDKHGDEALDAAADIVAAACEQITSEIVLVPLEGPDGDEAPWAETA
jgi:hypothetical protein